MRKKVQNSSDMEIDRKGLETEKALLKKQIDQVNALIGLVKGRIDAEEKSEKAIKGSEPSEISSEKSMSEGAKQLRLSNGEMERQLEKGSKEWDQEMQNTKALMKEHDDIMRKYYDTVDKYTRMMEKVEDERYRVEGDILDQGKTKLTEISKRDQLTLKKNQSSSEVTHLNTTVTVYKKQMQDLVQKYA